MFNQERYSRQIRFEKIGLQGCQRIRKSQAVLIGCGALGSTIANALVRAGIGQLTLVDADRLELSNLQRQTLFDENQQRSGMSKIEAARQKLSSINSEVRLLTVCSRIDAYNIQHIIKKTDLVLDGTDNFPSRYLINDYCVRENIPWIYGGCAASYGVAMPIIPNLTPCLRCVFPQKPDDSLAATADTVGIIGPIAHLVASIQAAEALKILSGHREATQPVLYHMDLWKSSASVVHLGRPDDSCPCCAKGQFEFLQGQP
jgi:adenylyltransferase/sulfurtransferase